jgi:hypothetical protein
MGEELPAPAGMIDFMDEFGKLSHKHGYTVEQVQSIIAPYAARIRQLERELAERKTGSIDTPEFRELLGRVQGWRDGAPIMSPDSPVGRASRQLIAYIDGRTVGGAPEGWHIERGDDVIRVSKENEGFATLRKDGDDPRETVLYRYFAQLATNEA